MFKKELFRKVWLGMREPQEIVQQSDAGNTRRVVPRNWKERVLWRKETWEEQWLSEERYPDIASGWELGQQLITWSYHSLSLQFCLGSPLAYPNLKPEGMVLVYVILVGHCPRAESRVESGYGKYLEDMVTNAGKMEHCNILKLNPYIIGPWIVSVASDTRWA